MKDSRIEDLFRTVDSINDSEEESHHNCETAFSASPEEPTDILMAMYGEEPVGLVHNMVNNRSESSEELTEDVATSPPEDGADELNAPGPSGLGSRRGSEPGSSTTSSSS
ncbi:hypothetical protein HPB47_014142 [Ixodes persulcatus]|uniref:Uncharacterized protein n=1 Tax=Ixodes persulcatus TaxID=34615 RepID=A0AC60QWN6_IXOPE|nr:hypothetical protein HPB47_014142 [Ixodes persulcatus]